MRGKVTGLRFEGELVLSSDCQGLLREIGDQLDIGVFPLVFNGGVVRSGEAHVVSSTPDDMKVEENDGKRKRSSERRPRQGQGARPRSPGSAPRISSRGFRKSYEAQMREVEIAYPRTVCWEDERGMWLLVKSTILEGLDQHATFLVGLPFEFGLGARSWAFWTKNGQHHWMGRRHTNFPDGSICAFALSEGVWSEGGDLIVSVTGMMTGSPPVSGVVSVMVSAYWPTGSVVGLTVTFTDRAVRPESGVKVNHWLPPKPT